MSGTRRGLRFTKGAFHMKARLIRFFGNSYLAGRRLSPWRMGFLVLRDIVSKPFLTAASRPPPKISELGEICVAKPDYLGDLLMVVPTCQLLRKIAPQAKINLLIGGWTHELAEFLREKGIVDEVIVCSLALLDRSRGSFVRKVWRELLSRASAIRTLRRKKIDLFLDLRAFSPNSWSIGSFSRARYRVGFGLRGMAFTYHHLIPFDDRKPMGQLFLDSLTCLVDEIPVYAGPNIPSAETLETGNFSPRENVPYLVVQLYSGERKRNVLSGQWRKILENLRDQFELVLVGTTADEENAVQDGLLLSDLRSLMGKTTISDLLRVIGGSAGVLSIDSVSAHIGLAYGKAVAVLMVEGISDSRSYPETGPYLAFFSGASINPGEVSAFLSSGSENR